MKGYVANLLNSVVSSYDKTKTTIAGRVFSKTINSQTVLGPPLTQFIDTQTTAATTPSLVYFNDVTSRMFVLSTISSSPTVLLYNFNVNTGVYTYVGKVILTLANAAATTHTVRGFKVDDSNSSNIKIFLSTTGSVVINGGTFMAYGLALADFTPGGTTIFSAIATGAKACYFLQDPAAQGTAHVATTAGGTGLPFFSTNVAYNTKVYQQNGTAALPQIFVWDYSTSPAVANTIASVSAQTTLYAGTSPSAFFTSGATALSVFAANDPVVITGTVPTAFTASTASATQTVYFIRDIQNITGNWYFNLAATSGGAAITPTSNVSGTVTLMRAFGSSSNTFSYKTGVLSPALTGTILQSNSFGYCMPTSAPLNATLNGQDCFYISTSTQLYLFKLSDLSSGSTSWPSLTGANLLGTGIDITAPTAINAVYSSILDRFIYQTATSFFVIKQLQNNAITAYFGGSANAWMETLGLQSVPISVLTVVSMYVHGGWLFVGSSTAGQRGVVAIDLRSDDSYGYSYITSPVIASPSTGAFLSYIQTIEQLFDTTDSVHMQIRSAATSGDALFNTAAGGWVDVKEAINNNYGIQAFIQFRVGFYIQTFFANSPAQINDINYVLTLLTEISDNWEGSVDNTTQNGASPCRSAFRLQTAYASAVPTMYFRAYDDSGNLVISANTSANASSFEYTTNNGTSWNPLGTIPNTPLTTELRYNWTSPPGVRVTCSLRES